MPDKNIELTRRKVLASVGAVGAAGVGAGAGTSALFSDDESFTDNTLTAGTLDLRMDWEEHYSYPQIYDGFSDPTTGLDVIRRDPNEDPDLDASNYEGLPIPQEKNGQDPVVWVNTDDLMAYFQNTTIEAFPDAEGGEIQSNFGVTEPCKLLADLPAGLSQYNDESSDPGRTRNADTYDSSGDSDGSDADEAKPLLNLTDVKPGDYGEFTFSAHLCDNDGYLWLDIPRFQESENGYEEPEPSTNSSGDTDDSGDPDGAGELAENIQTTLWYDDDCSNRIDGEPEPLSLMVVVDTSGSVDSTEMQTVAAAANSFAEQLNGAPVNVEAGLITFGGSDVGSGQDFVTLRQDVVDIAKYVDSTGNGKFSAGGTATIDGTSKKLLPASGDGQTPTPHALDVARELLNDSAQNDRRSIIYLGDGQPAYATSNSSPALNSKKLVDVTKAGQTDPPAVTTSTGDAIVSDEFDGLEDDDGNTGTIQETLLVARDIDMGGRADTDAERSTPPDQSGEPVEDNKDDISGTNGITIRSIGVGTTQSFDPPTTRDFLTGLATRPGLFYDSAFSSDLVDLTDEVIDDLNVITGEQVFFRGTLRELKTETERTPGGIPLDGSPQTNPDDFDELSDPEDSSARQDFDASSTQCFGLAWWLPADVDNRVQGDSVQFDLGFFAQQSRNSSGSS